jgi:hypothetical protein
MNVVDERSRSFWVDTASLPYFPPMAGDERTDVLVIGGGIAGLSVAYELLRVGRSVAVLDRGRLGGMTARTTAHLASAMDDGYDELIRRLGETAARDFYESQHRALNRMQQIVLEEEIDCDFARVESYLFAAAPEDVAMLEAEEKAARSIGFAGVQMTAPPMPYLGTGSALLFPQQGRVNPLQYLSGLIRAIEKMGGKIFCNTAVTETNETDEEATATTFSGRQITAKAIVCATNSPIVAPLTFHAKQAPYRTYAFAATVTGDVPDALYWDTAEPYHYVRLATGSNGKTILIAGGEDHKSGEANDMEARFARLEAWTRERFPIGEVTHRWSGQVNEPIDDMPFIGQNPGDRRIYVATGDSGQGVTTGVVAGMILADLIEGRENAWAKSYDPSRVTLAAAGTFLKEQVDVVKQLVEHLTPGERDSFDDLSPGEGAVVRDGLQKIAAYRDEDGALLLRSATCSHAGCVVQWNGFERCWDCPCHGSQFATDGSVLTGPATEPLGIVDTAQATTIDAGGVRPAPSV